MANTTYQQPPQLTVLDGSVLPEDWELTTTITQTPIPVVEACDTNDGCKPSCASACVSK
ncbi:FxLD family lanthipeptide [Streptomyces thermoalcalitolerans]|uniref:FxLD family lantipeptide n=1 Tax=Streptomyces thermoalcalitolerans TaxID=65605 RepID=A0ABP3Z5K1_9ACTN